ncbi:MAG: hypothetical protein ABW321_04515 [Polyangiales bacterium]
MQVSLSSRMRSWAKPALLCAAACAWPTLVFAYDSLFGHVRVDRSLADVFVDGEATADVQDGFLIGTGTERVRHLPDGRLSIERTRHYTSVRHKDTRQVAKLPEPWDARLSVLLEPSLRLIRADTRLHFKRSGDTVFPDKKLSEQHDWIFEADRTLLTSLEGGKRLRAQDFNAGKVVKDASFDYPHDSMPLEVIGLYLSLAVKRGIDRFDFDLLANDGSVHGVRSQVVRTRDFRALAKGYPVPKERLVAKQPLAVVDMRLASPIKYVFFPHHFYMAFSIEHPDQLWMMWGGAPDDNLQAFRRDAPPTAAAAAPATAPAAAAAPASADAPPAAAPTPVPAATPAPAPASTADAR